MDTWIFDCPCSTEWKRGGPTLLGRSAGDEGSRRAFGLSLHRAEVSADFGAIGLVDAPLGGTTVGTYSWSSRRRRARTPAVQARGWVRFGGERKERPDRVGRGQGR